MIQGLYTAAGGMIANDVRQSTTANNIANASTVGFRKMEPVQMGFYKVFTGKVRTPTYFNAQPVPAGGTRVVETFTDLSQGTMRSAGDPLSLALEGPGYFVVDTPDGEAYTRSGNFTQSMDGRLITQNGFAVQSMEGQPIDVRGANVEINDRGEVAVDGTPAGRLRLVEFANPERLQRVGGSLYRASDEVAEQMAEGVDTRVMQHMLEGSNVNLPKEMIRLTLGMRAYEANQRVVSAIDGTMGRLIDQVAMPR